MIAETHFTTTTKDKIPILCCTDCNEYFHIARYVVDCNHEPHIMIDIDVATANITCPFCRTKQNGNDRTETEVKENGYKKYNASD